MLTSDQVKAIMAKMQNPAPSKGEVVRDLLRKDPLPKTLTLKKPPEKTNGK